MFILAITKRNLPTDITSFLSQVRQNTQNIKLTKQSSRDTVKLVNAILNGGGTCFKKIKLLDDLELKNEEAKKLESVINFRTQCNRAIRAQNLSSRH